MSLLRIYLKEKTFSTETSQIKVVEQGGFVKKKNPLKSRR